MKGIELQGQALVSEGLTLAANFGYLDSEYDEFTFDSGFGIVDNSGLEFRRAPEYTGSISGTYEWDMAGGQAWVRGAFRFIDDLFVEQTNRAELKNGKQNYLDASINYQRGGATFSLFGRNLTDEDALAHGLEQTDPSCDRHIQA